MKKIHFLLISTIPFDLSGTMRYFNFIDINKFSVMNIYCNGIPRSNCARYIKINEKQLLKNKLFNANNTLTNEITNKINYDYNNNNYKPLKISKSIKRSIRDWIWNGQSILTNKLLNTIKDFDPQFILVDQSDYLFISNLAEQLSQTLNLKVIKAINDDYIISFNKHPVFHRHTHKLYRQFYEDSKKCCGFIFISDKIKNAYLNEFKIKENKCLVIYPNSPLTFFSKKQQNGSKFVFFGNIGLGRFQELVRIKKIIKNLDLTIYPNSINKSQARIAHKNKIVIKKPVPQQFLFDEIRKYDFILIVESFKAKNIKATRYSLSTKTSDCLKLSMPLLCIAPRESGLSNFFSKYNLVTNTYLNSKNNIKYIYSKVINEKPINKIEEILKNKLTTSFVQNDFFYFVQKII